MPPIRNHPREHVWTPYEMQTMLSLIVRGVHLQDYETTNRSTTEHAARQRSNENFCTALNDALHGDDYFEDIYKKDIIKQLNKMLLERKHVVGLGGLVERSGVRHLTRAINNAWKRGSQLNFDGSIEEWENFRKRELENESGRSKGLCSLEEEEDKQRKEQEAVKLATIAAEDAIKSRTEDREGNRSYIQGAFGTKTSEEIAQLFTPKGSAPSRGSLGLRSSSQSHQTRRPTMSSTIMPYPHDRETYDSEPEPDASGEMESGYDDDFYSVSVNPHPYNGLEVDYAVQGSRSASTGIVEGDATNPSNGTHLPQSSHKRKLSYTAAEFMSTSDSPRIACTPLKSSFQNSLPQSSSAEVVPASENIPGSQQGSSLNPPEKKRKLPGMLRRKLADSSAQRKAGASFSLNANAAVSSTGLPVSIASGVDAVAHSITANSDYYAVGGSLTTLRLPDNTVRDERNPR